MGREPHREDRRAFIRRSGYLTAAGLFLPNVLSACGGDDDGGSSGTSAGTNPSTAPSSTATSLPATDPNSASDLPRFDPDAPAGSPSPRARAFAFPNPFDAALFVQISDILDEVSSSRDVEYLTAISNGDPARLVEHSEGFLARNAGVLFLSPVEEEATTPVAERAVADGVGSFGVFRGFTHLQVVEDQYAIGYSQGTAAVRWINENLGGNAEVAYFNEDNAASIVPRHTGVLDALREGGSGITVVSDQQVELTTEAGANAMNTILQAHPNVKVVMGGSGVIAGVFAAFEALGRSGDSDVYLSSIAGGDDALQQIIDGTIHRATFGEPWLMWAYAIGQFGADWLDGKSIPRVISAPGGLKEISTPDAAEEFRAAMSDPAGTWETRRDEYISMYGNINYDQRDSYWTERLTELPTG